MALLYDWKSKEWTDVPDSEASAKVLAGTHSFESGIDVPVVSPTGEVGTVKSDTIGEDFEAGFRIATPEDTRRAFAKIGQEQNAQLYDDPTAAAIAGLARYATFGLSDVALNAAGVGEGVRQLKEQNPLASTAGELAGIIANPAITTGMNAVGQGVKALTGVGKLADEVAATRAFMGPLTQETSAALAAVNPFKLAASQIAGSIAKNTAEGAFLGIGSGISEAALGDPNEVAENLFAGVKNGALFGSKVGMVAGGLTAVKQPLFDFTQAVTSKLDDIVQSTARKSAEKTLIPALTEKESAELLPEARELLKDPEMRRQAFEGGLDNFNKAVKDQMAIEEQLNKDTDATRKQLVRFLKAEPKVVQDDINTMVSNSRGDLMDAMKASKDQERAVYQNLDNVINTYKDQGPQVLRKVVNDTEEVIDALKKSGDPKAYERANLLQEALDAGVPTEIKNAASIKSMPDNAFYGTAQQYVSLADEIALARRLRQLTPVSDTGLNKYAPKARTALADFRDALDTTALKGHPIPEIGALITEADRYTNAYKGLEKFVTSGTGKAFINPKTLIGKLQLPEKAEAFNNVLNRLSEFTPELKKVQESLGKVMEQDKAVTEFQAALRRKMQDVGSNAMSSSDIIELAKNLGPMPKIEDAINKLRSNENLQQQMAAMANSPIDKLILLKRTAGESVSQELLDLQKHAGAYEKLSKLGSLADAAEPRSAVLNRMMSSIGRHAGTAYIGHLIGGPMGAAALVSGTKVASHLVNGLNPYNTLRTVTMIEQASRKAANLINKGVKNAVDGLTSDTVRQTVLKGSQYKNDSTLEERRKTFKDRADQLAQFTIPANQATMLKKSIGELPSAPGIYKSLTSQGVKAGMFLASKLPKDPLMGKTMFANDTGWEPSDFELAKFERYSDAVDHPMQVLENIANGSVTPEEIETLQNVYPNIYKNLQNQLSDAIVDNGKTMSYQQKLTLSQMFQIPVDYTMQPDFVNAMQTNFAGGQQQQAAPAGEPGSTNPHPARLDIDMDKLMTPTQKVTYS